MTNQVTIQPLSTDEIKAGDISFRPAFSPAVLDTGTWNVAQARAYLQNAASFLGPVALKIMDGTLSVQEAQSDNLTLFPASIKQHNGFHYILARFPDGQRALLAVGVGSNSGEVVQGRFNGVQLEPLGKAPGNPVWAALIPTTIDNVRYFVENLAPTLGPRAMGTMPRLGIGDRMTRLVFPGTFDALAEMKLPANVIQNSIGRELAPIHRLLSREPLPQTYLPGLGNLSVGHTGASIEGLWLEGVLWGIQMGAEAAPWGADADHAPVKRSTGSEGMDRAKELLACARDYTFFTMDTSDLFDYRAAKLEGAELQAAFERTVPDVAARKALLARHTREFDAPSITGSAGRHYTPGEEQVIRFVVKYWGGLAAAQQLNDYIATLRHGRGYDFEFSMDERPLDISALESVTPDEEVIFVLRELKERGVRTTHVAPNFGVEKGYDYRLPDGRSGLEQRSARMAAIARQFEATLDYHSGDDLARETRRGIARGTGGALDFKISPILQTLYAQVLADLEPKKFRWWWDLTRRRTEEEAARGEKVAEKYLQDLVERETTEGTRFQPRVDDHFFWNYCFTIVGAKDKDGGWLYREEFYDVSAAVEQETRTRTKDYIEDLAHDVGLC
jgi:hypothetical protein